ncbi:hypothetical protein F4679DRAFT_562915 [Xylaria curta]|nr:hypothetical protein F4679DRAFT_562915 [Xylaria curta]
MGFSAFVGCVLLVAGWSWSRFGRLLLSSLSLSPLLSLSALYRAAVAAAASDDEGVNRSSRVRKTRSYGMINYFSSPLGNRP